MEARRNTKTVQKKKENANHPCTALTKSRHWTFMCSQGRGRKRTDANWRSLHDASYEIDGICRVKKIHWHKLLGHTNTAQTQHYLKELRILRNLFKVKH